MNRVEPAHVPGCFKMFKTTGTHRELGHSIHGLVTAIQVYVYIGNMVSRLSGEF